MGAGLAEMRLLTLKVVAIAALLPFADAAYDCQVCVDAVATSSGSGASASDTFCPQNDWYVCLDDAKGQTWSAADAAAEASYGVTLAQIAGAGVGITGECQSATHRAPQAKSRRRLARLDTGHDLSILRLPFGPQELECHFEYLVT